MGVNELYHHGILGQKWGVRRWQNPDGSYTEEGRQRYGIKGSRTKKVSPAPSKYASSTKEIADPKYMEGVTNAAKVISREVDKRDFAKKGLSDEGHEAIRIVANHERLLNESCQDRIMYDKNSTDVAHDLLAEVHETLGRAYDELSTPTFAESPSYQMQVMGELAAIAKASHAIWNNRASETKAIEAYDRLDKKLKVLKNATHSDTDSDYLAHHGIEGQKWGRRRWQNPDGSLTEEGRRRYGYGEARGGKAKSMGLRNASEMTDKELETETKRLNAEVNYAEAVKRNQEAFYKPKWYETAAEKAKAAVLKGAEDAVTGFISNAIKNTVNHFIGQTPIPEWMKYSSEQLDKMKKAADADAEKKKREQQAAMDKAQRTAQKVADTASKPKEEGKPKTEEKPKKEEPKPKAEAKPKAEEKPKASKSDWVSKQLDKYKNADWHKSSMEEVKKSYNEANEKASRATREASWQSMVNRQKNLDIPKSTSTDESWWAKPSATKEAGAKAVSKAKMSSTPYKPVDSKVFDKIDSLTQDLLKKNDRRLGS